MRARSESRQDMGGAGTLAMVMTLLLIAHLSLLYSHRALLFEQRASASQIRAVRAQEAAQAGIDWAVSRLNDTRSVDIQCLPTPQSPDAAPATVRARWERSLTAAVPWRPACVQTETTPDWQCQCPDSGTGQMPAPATTADVPAFTVALQTGPRAGLWTLTAEGCSHPGPDCADDNATEPDGRYRVSTVLAALGQVVQPPLAALTSVGAVALSEGASVVNADSASGGTTVHSGGAVTLQAPAKVHGPPGQPAAAGIVTDDPPLSAGADALWRRLFGLDAVTLRALPTWQTVACAGGCTGSDLDSAWRLGARALWLDGDLALAQGRWGSADTPLLLVVRGTLQIGPDAVVHGLVVAGRVDIRTPTTPRSLLRGALVSLDTTTLGGAFDLVRDAAVLARTAGLGSVLAPVPGSWFDPHTR
nr:hypothetical protein [Sphaerotilus sp.]